MIKKFTMFGLGGFMILGLVLSFAFTNNASATSTYAVNAITETAALTINAGAATALTLGSSATSGNIVIGGAQTTGTITIGAATGQTGNVTIYGTITGGANSLLDNTTTANSTMFAGLTSGTVTIGNATATGAFTIRGAQTSGANGLFTAATTSAINIGTACTTCTMTIGGAGANVITIGDVTGATSGTTLIGGAVTIDGQSNYVADTGAADVYVATLAPALTAYVAGFELKMKVTNVNATTTPTVNVNGLGAKTIVKRAATALATGDMPAGAIAVLIYDGTNFQLINPVVN